TSPQSESPRERRQCRATPGHESSGTNGPTCVRRYVKPSGVSIPLLTRPHGEGGARTETWLVSDHPGRCRGHPPSRGGDYPSNSFGVAPGWPQLRVLRATFSISAMKRIGRPPKPPDERRSETFLIRLTKDEARTLKQASRQLGISAGEILRQGGL